MKNIKKISIALALLIILEQSHLTAFGKGSNPMKAVGVLGGGGDGGNGVSHSGGSNTAKAAVGASAVHQSDQSANNGDAAADGGDSSGSGDSGGSSATPTPTSTPPALPVAAPINQQYAAPVATDVPTSINNNAAIPAIPTQQDATNNAAQPAEKSKQEDPAAKEEPIQQSQAEKEDQTNIVPDQNDILDKMKKIDNYDEKLHFLLTQDSMNMLFNNFVHFKNFIVHNFTKEKMMSLSQEFFNQIYPKDTVQVINKNVEEHNDLKVKKEKKQANHTNHNDQPAHVDHADTADDSSIEQDHNSSENISEQDYTTNAAPQEHHAQEDHAQEQSLPTVDQSEQHQDDLQQNYDYDPGSEDESYQADQQEE